jgi:hypothetical protein
MLQTLALQPIGRPAAVPPNQPREELAAIWGPRSPNLILGRCLCHPDKESIIGLLGGVAPVLGPSPHQHILPSWIQEGVGHTVPLW